MSIDKDGRNFRFIDLFCGVGGFHIALEALGGECVLASDLDSRCRSVYQSNHGLTPLADIRDIDISMVPDHDLLSAGFPCQPFSKGGSRLGFLDQTRGTLFYEVLRVLEAKRPRFVILENVKNLITHDDGRTWQVIVSSLRELGYQVNSKPLILSPHLLSPKNGGAPQHRERVIILAQHISYSLEENPSTDWDFMPNVKSPTWSVSDWDFIRWMSDNPPHEINLKKYKLSKTEKMWIDSWAKLLIRIRGSISSKPLWVSSMRARVSTKGLPEWKAKISKSNREIYIANKEIIDAWKLEFKVPAFPKSKQKFEWQAQGRPLKRRRDVTHMLIQFRPSGIRVKPPTYTGALVAMVQTPIAGWLGRRLTPSEAGILQGFPPDFQRDEDDYYAYKQYGNAVNVNVVKYATRMLFDHCKF